MFLICFLNFEDHIFNLFPAILRLSFVSFFIYFLLEAETCGQSPTARAKASEEYP